MTEAMVDDALVADADRETLNAIRIALYRAHPEIPPFAAGIIEPYLARHRLAGVAAGREEGPYPTIRVLAAKASVEATIHQINNHWWNKRIRPDARDLRVLLDFVAATAIRQRGE